jgi:hypothetical protein
VNGFQDASEVMMEIVSFDKMELDAATMPKQLRCVDVEILRRLLDSAGAVIAPVAAFQIGYLDEKGNDSVVINGVRFHSRVLRRNLDAIGRVFPFVLTVGKAFDKLVKINDDMLEKYLLDEIGNIALRKARLQFENHLRRCFALEKISCMAPGSLEDWPIEEQKSLFSLMSGVESAIDVHLTESLLMIPQKSISGIYFPSEVTFLSCQLCPRKRCDARKARYDESKAHEYGILTKRK